MTITIKSIENNCFVQAQSLEEAAVLEGHKEASETRSQARESRLTAQKDEIDQMSRAADKLRSMARNTVGSGLWRGVLGIASAGLSLGTLSDSKSKSVIYNAASEAAKATGSIDAFGFANGSLQAEKQEIEICAKRASHEAEQAADRESHAKKLCSSYEQRFEQILQAKHAAEMAAIKP